MRHIKQKGPALEPRIIAVPVKGKTLSLRLQKNKNLLESIAEAFAREGFESGVVEFDSLALGPIAYVMPALSKSGENAAFYSDTFRPDGITVIESGALTFGRRNGEPFFHCHALWRESDGRRNGGHILPEETVIAEAAVVQAFGFNGGMFEGNFDPETNFTLFGPIADGTQSAGNAYALRLRPNQDFCTALEDFCTEKGISKAHIRGGVGSIIGAHFADERIIEPFATEVFIRKGKIENMRESLCADVEIGLVNYMGDLAQGILKRGNNPVLMTFELVLVIES